MEGERIIKGNRYGFRFHPKLIVALKFCVGVGLLIGVATYVNVDELKNSLLRAHASYISIGFLLMALNIGIQFLRWRFLLRLLDKDVSDEEVISSLLIGFSAGFFTPAQVGEYGGRIVALRTRPTAHVLALSLIDKIYIFIVTVGGGTLCAYFYFTTYLPQYWSPMFSALAAIITILCLTGLLYPRIVKQLLQKLPRRLRSSRAVASFDFVQNIFRWSQAKVVLFLTVLLYSVIVVQYYVFVLAFGPVSLTLSILCAANILFIKSAILPISIGDLGVRESAAVFFFSHAGVSAASAFNASLCIFVTNIALPGIAGGLMMMNVSRKDRIPKANRAKEI